MPPLASISLKAFFWFCVRGAVADGETVVVYQDEVHFQVSVSVTRKWVLKGSCPQVKSAPGRESIAYSGYVVPSTGELLLPKPSWFNFETVIQSFRDFIRSYPVQEGKRIYLVLDNAPWHKKAVRLVQTEALEAYQDIRDKLTLLFLPPYSPVLNPIEQCWRITRREMTHNTYYANKNEFEKSLDDYYAQYREPNEKFSSLCSFEYKN